MSLSLKQLADDAQQEFEAGRYAAASELLEASVTQGRRDSAVYVNLGLCRQRLGDLTGAATSFREACALDPMMADAWAYLGDVLRSANQPEQAFQALQKATVLAPEQAIPHVNLGLFLLHYGRVGEAVDMMRQALRCDPGSANVWCNLGIALQDAGSIPDALAAYRKALVLAPDHLAAASNILMGLQYDTHASARDLTEAAAAWGRRISASITIEAAPPRTPGRLRIGYVSGDFLMHPVGWFFLPVVQAHDKTVVEIFCYANQSSRDLLTDQIEAAVEHWREIRALDDAAVYRLIRDDGIDVLVDLSGHTSGNRLGVFARKPAHVQLAWLGYFASTGLTTIDAAIFSADQVGKGGESYFVEPVETLSRSHFCYAPPAYAPPLRDRSDDNQPVVFGSFSNTAKLNDDVIRTWAKILIAVPNSRLMLKWKIFIDPRARAAMLARFRRLGCSADRIELRGPSEHEAMLREYGDIDIALDPYPFSGALTTCEALWMGVPVVTLEWQRPVARQTLALLRSVGLGELVADTPAAYVEICARLAGDRVSLRQLRLTMRDRLAASPLFDGAGLAHVLERIYQQYSDRMGIR